MIVMHRCGWVVRMEYKFTIPGRLDGLNEYTAANRTNPHKGGHMKQKNEDGIIWQIRRQLPGIGTITAPVLIYYRFFEKDRRRDNDNILSCAAKFVQDSLKKAWVIKDDNQRCIPHFYFDTFPNLLVDIIHALGDQDHLETIFSVL